VVAIAVVAAIALAVTVLVARADLRGVEEATVRGEAESLITRLHESEEARRSGPPTAASLAEELARLGPSGLTFLEFRAGDIDVSAGAATIASAGLGANALVIEGGHALVVSGLPSAPAGRPDDRRPPRGWPAAMPPPGLPPPGLPPPPPEGARVPASLVIEFTPSLLPRLQAAMNRTAIVGAGAVLVLLGFAAVLSVRAARRSRHDQRAEQERRLMALGQMSGVMAHELRNPLASLKGNAQLLGEMLPTGTREHAKAELVVREAERLERLTQDLLSFVREGELARREVSPTALVDRAIEGMPRERIVVDAADAPPTLWVDEARLAAAVGNLVRNALQSTDGAARGGGALVEVRDRGPGIAAGDEERIFEPFFTTRIHGTGLGLAVARRAVEQHGGTLRAESPRDGGALFRVVLPDVGERT
jgi:two-component system sensor histidine kinase HydH